MAVPTTIRTGKLGKKELRLVRKDNRFFGLADGTKYVEGDDADDVWRRLHDEAGKADPRYFGYGDARARFLHFFPGGFRSDRYVEKERNYKVEAKARLDATVPLERATRETGYAEAVYAVIQATDLLFPVEKARLRDALRGPHGDAYIQASARFAESMRKADLVDLERALRPNDIAKWTAATYLPFLWRPQAHMFLKPKVTQDFATRVGHRFAHDYEARLHIPVYESLLDLVESTTKELADLAPRDRIDVQSFIYVVGEYREGD